MATLADEIAELEGSANSALHTAKRTMGNAEYGTGYALIAIAKELRALRIVLGGLMLTIADKKEKE